MSHRRGDWKLLILLPLLIGLALFLAMTPLYVHPH